MISRGAIPPFIGKLYLYQEAKEVSLACRGLPGVCGFLGACVETTLDEKHLGVFLRRFQQTPWNISQTPNQQFMKEFLLYWWFRDAWGMYQDVCRRFLRVFG